MKPPTVECSYTELMDIEKVIPNPRNPNKHSGTQIKLLAKIIAAQGWRTAITVSERSGFVVRGHCRLLAAKELGLEQVPVDVQKYKNEAAEYADLIADNRLSELSDMDRGELKDLLSEIDTGGFDMDLTGYDADELEKLMTALPPLDLDEGSQDEPEAKRVHCPKCGFEFEVPK